MGKAKKIIYAAMFLVFAAVFIVSAVVVGKYVVVSTERNSQYGMFMRELTTYTRSGKVPHDDAADMLSLAENELRNLSGSKVEVFQRPW